MAKKTSQAAKGKSSTKEPQRTDYPLRTKDAVNGDHRPIDVYGFTEAMRNWREQSSQSTTVVR